MPWHVQIKLFNIMKYIKIYYYSDIHAEGIMNTLDAMACTIYFFNIIKSYLIIIVIYMQKVIMKGL